MPIQQLNELLADDASRTENGNADFSAITAAACHGDTQLLNSDVCECVFEEQRKAAIKIFEKMFFC